MKHTVHRLVKCAKNASLYPAWHKAVRKTVQPFGVLNDDHMYTAWLDGLTPEQYISTYCTPPPTRVGDVMYETIKGTYM